MSSIRGAILYFVLAMSSLSAAALSAADAEPAGNSAAKAADPASPARVAQEPAKDSPQKPAEEKAASPSPSPSPSPTAPAKDDGGPEVHLIGMTTDVARRYRNIIPPLPFPPFSNWRRWFKEHERAVHCVLEWRDDEGQWWHGELRSTHFDPHSAMYRVGYGEFPGTGYDAYGVYIIPGRQPREIDERGRKVEVVLDEVVNCDYRAVDYELRNYAAKYARPGDPGTGGCGDHNVGLGGPAYKPAQNSNTMINYVLQHCGVNHPAPDLAVGWYRIPRFPFSTDADMPKLDCTP